jgi:ribosomal protein L37E
MEKKYARKPLPRGARTEYHKQWRHKNPGHRRKYYERNPIERANKNARNRAESAVKKGYLPKLPCQVCRNTESYAHHLDYSKPFEVIWLCIPHHTQIHQSPNSLGSLPITKALTVKCVRCGTDTGTMYRAKKYCSACKKLTMKENIKRYVERKKAMQNM